MPDTLPMRYTVRLEPARDAFTRSARLHDHQTGKVSRPFSPVAVVRRLAADMNATERDGWGWTNQDVTEL
jgi:hypothetical protein